MKDDAVGLREMRQNASDLVRRAENGERVTITVSGRPAAVLGPIVAGSWRSWNDVADIFSSATDTEWESDRNQIDNLPRDPWEDA